MCKWLGFYHPSTVLFIDDQKVFLEAIKHKMPSNMLALYCDQPQQALNLISDHPVPTKKYFSEFDNIEFDQVSDAACFTLKIDELSKISYEKKRFSEISVVVVDRKMPDMDGLTFCRNIADKSIKKIMLTASNDRKVVTEAFNEGIIDFFLLKDSPDLTKQLLSSIENLQKEYFFSINQELIGNFLPCAHNKKLQQFIQNMIRHFHGIEFYLLDKLGSTLIVQQDGTAITLAITSEKVMDNFAGIAEEQEELELADSLLQRKALVFFPNEQDTMRPANDWSDFVYDAKPVPEQNDLYYAIIDIPLMQPLDTTRIISQENYQREHVHI